MRLINTEHGQSFQKFIADEVRPPSGVYIPDFLRALAVRYSFMNLPEIKNPMPEGAKLQAGKFHTPDKVIEIKELGIYSDGIIAITYNTGDSDMLIDDIISLSITEFGFRNPSTLFPRTYTSSVVIEFNSSIDRILKAMEKLREDFSTLMSEHYGRIAVAETSRISIAADPSTLPPYTNFNFSVERRGGVPYRQNRYFSAASLSTALHLEFLQKFEGVLK